MLYNPLSYNKLITTARYSKAPFKYTKRMTVFQQTNLGKKIPFFFKQEHPSARIQQSFYVRVGVIVKPYLKKKM